MTNFIYDNTALPATKSDRNTVTDATRQWAASDANAVFSALTDIRTAVSGTVFNVKAFGAVGNGSTDDTAASGWRNDTWSGRLGSGRCRRQPRRHRPDPRLPDHVAVLQSESAVR